MGQRTREGFLLSTRPAYHNDDYVIRSHQRRSAGWHLFDTPPRALSGAQVVSTRVRSRDANDRNAWRYPHHANVANRRREFTSSGNAQRIVHGQMRSRSQHNPLLQAYRPRIRLLDLPPSGWIEARRNRIRHILASHPPRSRLRIASNPVVGSVYGHKLNKYVERVFPDNDDRFRHRSRRACARIYCHRSPRNAITMQMSG